MSESNKNQGIAIAISRQLFYVNVGKKALTEFYKCFITLVHCALHLYVWLHMLPLY